MYERRLFQADVPCYALQLLAVRTTRSCATNKTYQTSSARVILAGAVAVYASVTTTWTPTAVSQNPTVEYGIASVLFQEYILIVYLGERYS